MLSILLVACGESAQSALVVDEPAPGIVGTVTYERGDDVYIQEIGGEPEQLERNASYPRFSPQGSRVAMVSGNDIVVFDGRTNQRHVVAHARNPRAVAWHPQGNRLFYTDADSVWIVDLKSRAKQRVVSGTVFLELDVAPDGRALVGTVHRLGFSILTVDLKTGQKRRLAGGCSASFSPDGRQVSRLDNSHTQLSLLAFNGKSPDHILKAPGKMKYDNHFWSNHPNWIVGEDESDQRDIILIHAVSGEVKRVTTVGNASRGDVFIRSVDS
ncbi:MAG: hypothetical protein DHS20C01_13080 [marine bacterium B5-7]|nr:MAG: hypothetical protein DHS20C01_13080 [marine bacterium B5-7]